jgi:hypothetical protein
MHGLKAFTNEPYRFTIKRHAKAAGTRNVSPVLYLGEKHALRMPALRAHDREFNFHARSQGGILKPYESNT